jgi:hypothetical protein
MIQHQIMPIRPENRWLYPIDWLQISVRVRFTRAKGRCDHCRRPHGRHVRHLGDGMWWDDALLCWRDGRGKRSATARSPLPTLSTRVVLACAHLNHDPTDNRDRNLAALCQRCHMIHDADEHRRRRWQNAFRTRALGDLFLGRYPLIG